ncbi:MAG TPA: wax ester/triacylglycerol synthase family O-acyltransferase [Solirubrobacterales bacterium]|nr:wax ester/triacylglycerol synthase family O-acyltransferase [Solirubrobacterales bacterium]
MGHHLGALDTAFLELEEADAAAHMHIGWAMVFDRAGDGSVPTLEEIQRQTEERLRFLPRFRRRLSSPHVASLSRPSWEPAEDFDIAAHMRRAALPEPGGEAELLDWLGDFYSHRLDRSRPLWETTMLDGLEGGRWALVTKAHHCLVDGVSGASVAAALLDPEPHPDPSDPTLAELISGGEEGEGEEPGVLTRVGGALGAGVGTAVHPRRLRAALERSRAVAEMLIRDELIAAPHTSLDQPIGATRRIAAVDTSLAKLKRIKDEHGGTVNDVVLAATAGGLRRLFESRGELAAVDHVRAMVPVSLRAAGQSLALGNRVSSLFLDLPLAHPKPLVRYHETVAASRALKEGGQAAGGEALIELTGAAPPVVHGVAARLAFTPRLFNLTITNVPGPPATLYASGAPMRRVIPLVPIFAGHAVGVAVVSYAGTVSFGLNADRAGVPDLELMRAGIEETLASLAKP